MNFSERLEQAKDVQAPPEAVNFPGGESEWQFDVEGIITMLYFHRLSKRASYMLASSIANKSDAPHSFRRPVGESLEWQQ